MFEARVSGRAASLAAAVKEAAECLGRARFPLIAGLGSDVAGIREALALARRLRGAFDHMASQSVLCDLAVMQRGGWMCVSPGEVSRNCDLLLVAGPDVSSVWLDQTFAGRPPPVIVRLGTEQCASNLAVLRALVAGLSATRFGKRFAKLKSSADRLWSAKFGVAVWQPGSLDEPSVEMLMGLVRDLNRNTRFSAMPLAGASNANGANLVSGWLTGFPVRTSLAGAAPDYDPWSFAAGRLIASGESDAALWLSSFDSSVPDWFDRVPCVALVAKGTRPRQWPCVMIEVGTPGIDHDGIIYNGLTGALGWFKATNPTDAPRADDILSRINAARVPEDKAA